MAIVTDAFIRDYYNLNTNNINLANFVYNIDENLNQNIFQIHYANANKSKELTNPTPVFNADTNIQIIATELMKYIIDDNIAGTVISTDTARNINLKKILTNENINKDDKLNFLLNYKNNSIDPNGVNDITQPFGAIVAVVDIIKVFRGKLPNLNTNYKTNKNKNIAKANILFLIGNKIQNKAAAKGPPVQFSRLQTEYPGIVFSQNIPYGGRDNSIMSLINSHGNNNMIANFVNGGSAIGEDYRVGDYQYIPINPEYNILLNNKRDKLRELMLSLYIFLDKLTRIDEANINGSLNIIKDNLEYIGNSNFYKNYIENHDAYMANDSAKYMAQGIDDIIINSMKISFIIIARNIMNLTKFNNANKSNVYLAVDCICIILKKFCYVPTNTGNRDDQFNIFIYTPNPVNNGVDNYANRNLDTYKRLVDFCIIKLISITLGRNYQLYKEVIFKYIMTNVISVINIDPFFTSRLLFYFIHKTQDIESYSFLLFTLYRKILYYINFYQLDDSYNNIPNKFYEYIQNTPLLQKEKFQNVNVKRNIKNLVTSRL
jgi:hypothetical protein